MTSLVAQPSNYIKELLKLKEARGPHLVLFPFPSSACLESFWGNTRVRTEHTLKNSGADALTASCQSSDFMDL